MVLDFGDGSKHVEPVIPVTLNVDRAGTGTEKITPDNITVYAHNNILYINTPTVETVSVYSITGNLLYYATKPVGEKQIVMTDMKNQFIIVRGSSGWSRKLITK